MNMHNEDVPETETHDLEGPSLDLDKGTVLISDLAHLVVLMDIEIWTPRLD
jgi:hypothetical protein